MIERTILIQTEIIGVGRRAALRGGVVAVGLACFTESVLARHRYGGGGLGSLNNGSAAGYKIRLQTVFVLHLDSHGIGARFSKVDAVVVGGDPAGVLIDRAVLIQTEVIGVGRRAALRGGVIAVGLTGGAFGVRARHGDCGRGGKRAEREERCAQHGDEQSECRRAPDRRRCGARHEEPSFAIQF